MGELNRSPIQWYLDKCRGRIGLGSHLLTVNAAELVSYTERRLSDHEPDSAQREWAGSG